MQAVLNTVADLVFRVRRRLMPAPKSTISYLEIAEVTASGEGEATRHFLSRSTPTLVTAPPHCPRQRAPLLAIEAAPRRCCYVRATSIWNCPLSMNLPARAAPPSPVRLLMAPPTPSACQHVEFTMGDDDACLVWDAQEVVDWCAPGLAWFTLRPMDWCMPGLPYFCLAAADWSRCGVPQEMYL